MASRRFQDRRLGCRVELRVDAPSGAAADRALDAGTDRLDELDRRWSRFRPDSEVSRLNAAAGDGPLAVSADTLALVEAAVEAWRTTAGLVDATVLGALERLGYDRSFERLDPPPDAGTPADDVAGRVGSGVQPSEAVAPAPGCGAIRIDRAAGTVELPAGVGIDPGGLGKGRIADEVAAAVRGAGATGACIDLGGDVVVAGTAGDGRPWQVDVEDPLGGGPAIASLALAEGAVATSSVLRRRWAHRGRPVHHLVDPRTGAPARSDLVAATVVAGEAMWAEVLAKAAVLAGLADGVALLAASGASGLLVTDDGLAVRTAGFDDFEAAEALEAGGGR